eukprot:m.6968 g.6968  ORF g.6968 m.6968 type:complete len:389 (-) comp2684_c0_seq1:510-1676(-)
MSDDEVVGAVLSTAVEGTDEPCINTMQRIVDGEKGIISLAQGVTYWDPPKPDFDVDVTSRCFNSYGLGAGDGELIALLETKLAEENGLCDVEVMVTVGANQAFMNVLLSTCDPGDDVVLISPYFFNHHMALQLRKCGIHYCPRVHNSFKIDFQWLEAHLPNKKVLVVVNPCNPSGTLLSMEELVRLRDLCAACNVWLVVDNTYEYFIYDDDKEHCCIQGSHVVNIFSFSKAYGLMGWRVGYLSWSNKDLSSALAKVQDTMVICPTQFSQKLACCALRHGKRWCEPFIKGLRKNREIVFSCIREYDKDAIMGDPQGAIYAMVKLPIDDDEKGTMWLAHKHHVAVVPGSACGMRGYIRVAYANLSPQDCEEAAQKLRDGLIEMRENGLFK